MRAMEPSRDSHAVDGTRVAGLDDLARAVAAVSMSRGRALRLAVAALLGTAVASPLWSRPVAAQEGCTTCAASGDTGLCSTINADRPFQSCCVDTSTLTQPGPLEPSSCACIGGLQQTGNGRITIVPTCVPPDQVCRRLQACSRRRPKCPTGSVCVLGSCCATPADFSRGIGVCARIDICEPITTAATAKRARRGPTLTMPA